MLKHLIAVHAAAVRKKTFMKEFRTRHGRKKLSLTGALGLKTIYRRLKWLQDWREGGRGGIVFVFLQLSICRVKQRHVLMLYSFIDAGNFL